MLHVALPSSHGAHVELLQMSVFVSNLHVLVASQYSLVEAYILRARRLIGRNLSRGRAQFVEKVVNRSAKHNAIVDGDAGVD